MPTDIALVQRILQRGDEQAFRSLYQRQSPRLYQLLLRLAGGEIATAEDLLQETWLRTVRLLPEFRPDAELYPWVRGIAVNVSREWLRRTQRERRSHASIDPDDCASADPPPAMLLDLEQAITALSPGCRVVFVLHDVEGFTHDEIAERLGVSTGTSKSQLFAARRALRGLLSPRPAPEVRSHESA